MVNMKSRNSAAIRVHGQRSIPSTFLFRSVSKCSTNNEEGSIEPSKSRNSRSHLSLSEFLDRKLNSTSVLPIDKKKNISNSSEVEKLVSPSVDPDHPNETIFRDDHYRFGVPHEEPTPAIEDSVFKLFNGTQAGKVGKSSSEGFTAPARSENGIKRHSHSHLVVLGDDPRPKRRAYARGSCSNKKERPFYNHYENGTGWWDSEREGVDSDEVGAKEIWEGMGTTTLGGLDQHF